MNITFEHSFTGKRPSQKQVKTVLIKALKEGFREIELYWGENWIQVFKNSEGTIYGTGWIKTISGQDLANEIDRELNA